MKHRSVTRVLAVAAVVALLSAFALPAAAAPFGGMAPFDSWNPSVLVQWAQALWTGWFGTGDSTAEPSGAERLHGTLKHQLDPDGATATSDAPESDDGMASWDSTSPSS